MRSWESFLVDLFLPLVMGGGLVLVGIWVGVWMGRMRGK